MNNKDIEQDNLLAQDLLAQIESLQEEVSELQALYDTTVEHSTVMENHLDTLRHRMKSYLSPQLYRALNTEDSQVIQELDEHRRVKLVVYFSDIVGFSKLTDSIEPEFLSQILNSYLTKMSEIALKYGGTVDKFVGDAVMVFFGAPDFKDDVTHARQCVGMALEMREALYELCVEWKTKGLELNLAVRAGINFGFCTVGNFGSHMRMDYTIIGGAVNLAARLESLALPDHIYISNDLYNLIEDFVYAKFVGNKHVKGIHETVDVWDLISLKNEENFISPYCHISKESVGLNPVNIALDQLTIEQYTELKRALLKLLIRLSTATNPV